MAASTLRLGRSFLASRALSTQARRAPLSRAAAHSPGSVTATHGPERTVKRTAVGRGGVIVRASATDDANALADGLEAAGSRSVITFFATCGPGLEPVVAAELLSPRIGATDVQVGSAGVSFRGTRATGYRANLWLRSAIRVLVRLAAADLKIDPFSKGRRGGDAVYEFVKAAAPWAEVVPRNRTFAVDTRIRDCTDINSAQMVGTVAKNAICDALRDARGEKPDPPEGIADVPLFLTLYRDRAMLYRDMSGESLHKRGYRENIPIHRGALNEAAAAGILSLSGWMGAPEGLETVASAVASAAAAAGRAPVLLDPMCGSGTFLIEGALMAGQIAPGLLRTRWPFLSWPDHSKTIWATCLEEAKEASRTAEARQALADISLRGADIHAGALGLAEQAATAAGVRKHIKFTRSDVREWAPAAGAARATHVVTNPPWGLRLQGAEDDPAQDLFETWFQLGCFLRKQCGGADAFILTGNPDPAGKLFLRNGRRFPLTVGGIDCRLLSYTILDAEKRSETESWRARSTKGSEAPRKRQAAARRASSDAADSNGGSGLWADMSGDGEPEAAEGARRAGQQESAAAEDPAHPLRLRRRSGAAAESSGARSGGGSSPFASSSDDDEEEEGERTAARRASAAGSLEEGVDRAAPAVVARRATVVVAPPQPAGAALRRPKGGRWGGMK